METGGINPPVLVPKFRLDAPGHGTTSLPRWALPCREPHQSSSGPRIEGKDGNVCNKPATTGLSWRWGGGWG